MEINNITPLVSMMIATYNQPEYIVLAVESCLSQTYQNIEVVVGDDSTNEDVYNALKPLMNNSKLKYFRNEKNIGRVKNYRKLLYEYASGDWAIMLDGDDYYIDNNYIENAINNIKSNKDVVLVAAGFLWCDENINSNDNHYLVSENIVFDGEEIFYKNLKIAQHSTNLYNRKIAMDLNFYSLNSMGTDSEGLFKLCLNGNVVYLNDIVVIWRIHQNNNTFKPEDAIKQMKEMIFIDNVYDYAKNKIDIDDAKEWRRNMYNSMSYHILGLAQNSKSFFTVIRVTFWASKYWGLSNTFKFLKTFIWKSISNK